MFAFASPVTQVSRRRSASIELDQVIQDVTQSLQDPDSVLLADDIRDDIRASTLSIYPSPSHNRPAPYSAAPSYDGSQEPDQSRTQATDEASSISNGKRKRSSGVAPFAVMHMSSPPAAAELDDLNSSQKRRRSSRNVQVEPSPPYTEPSPPSTAQEHYDEATMQPAEQSFTEHPIDHQEVVHDTIATDPDTILETTEIDGDSIHERTEVDIVDVYDTLATIEENEAEPSHLQGKKAQATRHPPRSKQALYSQNDPNRAHTERRGAGVRSSVRLRSVTPFDDSTKTTRSGRVVHKPFQFWKNEGPVWEHGQMTGVTRAEDVPAEKRNFNRRRTNTRTRLNKDNVEEEIPEDLLPEAWEQETKIIRGPVNFWNPETGENDGSEVSEGETLKPVAVNADVSDIAFSHHASKYVDAGDGSFKYAKLVRIPFFGAGLLEIPPGGSKSAKSSRNMQMIFFIYEGKVTVDVAGMTFGITAGGSFIVPRGKRFSPWTALRSDQQATPTQSTTRAAILWPGSFSVKPASLRLSWRRFKMG